MINQVFVEFAKSGLANTVCGPIIKVSWNELCFTKWMWLYISYSSSLAPTQADDITYPLPCGLTTSTFDVFHGTDRTYVLCV